MIDYIHYLESIHFLLKIINGTGCDENELSSTARQHLLDMIKWKQEPKYNHNIPKYIQNVLKHHLSKAKILNLNFIEIKEKLKFMKNIFI
eukprot:97453_1